jgi:hypothetical protein
LETGCIKARERDQNKPQQKQNGQQNVKETRVQDKVTLLPPPLPLLPLPPPLPLLPLPPPPLPPPLTLHRHRLSPPLSSHR